MLSVKTAQKTVPVRRGRRLVWRETAAAFLLAALLTAAGCVLGVLCKSDLDKNFFSNIVDIIRQRNSILWIFGEKPCIYSVLADFFV